MIGLEPEPQSPAVMPLEFDGKPVRVVNVGGDPWWVAKDVCGVLGIGNVSDAVRGRADRENDGLDEDERRDDVGTADAIGRTQQMLCVNESGLYSLIFKSRKPDAKRFRKWVTSEVLPSIRKAGDDGFRHALASSISGCSTSTARPNTAR